MKTLSALRASIGSIVSTPGSGAAVNKTAGFLVPVESHCFSHHLNFLLGQAVTRRPRRRVGKSKREERSLRKGVR
jgi:hypothetical protein